MKVLIATDGSVHSQTAVEEFCRIFRGKQDLQITILSAFEMIVPLDAFATTAQFSETRNETAHQLSEKFAADASEIIKKQFPNAEINAELAMDFAERFIVERAKSQDADLIVVGSHGRGFWGRLTLGSVSDAVIHHAPCSVLVVRPKH